MQTLTLNQVLRVAILKRKHKRINKNKKTAAASAKIETRAATSGRMPTWGPPQGTQKFMPLSAQQKV